MSSAAEPKDDGSTRGDELPCVLEEIVERNERPRIEPLERLSACELRTITPEEIQILAATGC